MPDLQVSRGDEHRESEIQQNVAHLRSEHHRLAVEPIRGDTAERAEQQGRHGTRAVDDAEQERRAGPGRRSPIRLSPRCPHPGAREHAADPEQAEVAVLQRSKRLESRSWCSWLALRRGSHATWSDGRDRHSVAGRGRVGCRDRELSWVIRGSGDTYTPSRTNRTNRRNRVQPYSDQLDDWLRGRYHRPAVDREEVERGAQGRLTVERRTAVPS